MVPIINIIHFRKCLMPDNEIYYTIVLTYFIKYTMNVRINNYNNISIFLNLCIKRHGFIVLDEFNLTCVK